MRITFLAAALFALGCGSAAEKPTAVSGTLLKGGKAFTFTTQGLPPGDPGFRLMFHGPEGAGSEVNSAVFNAGDGSFQVPGPKGAGLKPGKYRVSVEKGAMGTPDEFKNAFKGEKSPLSVDIPTAPSTTV